MNNKWKEYITNPWTIVSLLVFTFWLGWTYISINSRLNALEEFQHTINIVEIQKTLSQIQVDVSRIKKEIDKK